MCLTLIKLHESKANMCHCWKDPLNNDLDTLTMHKMITIMVECAKLSKTNKNKYNKFVSDMYVVRPAEIKHELSLLKFTQ